MTQPHTTQAPLSGPPSGDTEPGTEGRRKIVRVLALIASALVLIWIAVAIFYSSGQSKADQGKREAVPPAGQPPAQTLQSEPRDEKIGSGG